jgi:hypothetical protein
VSENGVIFILTLQQKCPVVLCSKVNGWHVCLLEYLAKLPRYANDGVSTLSSKRENENVIHRRPLIIPADRVTGFGRIFTNWMIVYFGQFLHGKIMYEFGPKIGWATFWAISSQTHLVTLLTSKIGSNFFAITFDLRHEEL